MRALASRLRAQARESAIALYRRQLEDLASELEEAATEAEPESADMARRREKTAEMVGVIEPGLAFYQKLGDYWT